MADRCLPIPGTNQDDEAGNGPKVLDERGRRARPKTLVVQRRAVSRTQVHRSGLHRPLRLLLCLCPSHCRRERLNQPELLSSSTIHSTNMGRGVDAAHSTGDAGSGANSSHGRSGMNSAHRSIHTGNSNSDPLRIRHRVGSGTSRPLGTGCPFRHIMSLNAATTATVAGVNTMV